MELTPDLLLEAKFSPSRRGYDMAEVDDFLERCAEGLDVLLTRLRVEFDRAEEAEAALAELRGSNGHDEGPRPSAPDAHVAESFAPEPEPRPEPMADQDLESEESPVAVGEPMRILIAAERTAEAAVSEARAEAERIRSEAEALAMSQRSEAETLLERARSEAEAEARKAGEAARDAMEGEVASLRRDRDSLSENIRLLRDWMDDQRGRLRTTAETLQRLVDDPAAIGEVAPPPVVDPGPGTDPDDDEPAPEADRTDDGPVLFDVESDGEPTQAVPPFGDDLFADEGSDPETSNDHLL